MNGERPDESHTALPCNQEPGTKNQEPAPAESLRRQLNMLAQNNLDLRQLLHEAYDRLMPVPGELAFCNKLRAILLTSDQGPILPEA